MCYEMIDRGCGEERSQWADVLRNEYIVREKAGEKTDALREAAALFADTEPVSSALDRSSLKSAVETLSDSKNTVVFDDHGQPSVMVRIPAWRESELLRGSGSSAFHPAFQPDGRGYLVGKYQSSYRAGQACSLPLGAPAYGMDLDTVQALCRRKGKGWSVTPFALRMAIALRCRILGFLPCGNNNLGRDYFHPSQEGIPVGSGRTLCGSGPADWAHDGTANGVYDLNGNLNEWDVGFRLMNGEIQLITMDRLLAPSADDGPESPLWRAIDETGALVAPGTAGTLKYDAPGGHIRLARTVHTFGIGNCAFADMTAEPGLQPPAFLRLMGLYPEEDREGYGLGWRWISNRGEAMPLCGGANRALNHAGVFFVGASYPRAKNYELTGFRMIYRDEEGNT
jgi:hypothetical protein